MTDSRHFLHAYRSMSQSSNADTTPGVVGLHLSRYVLMVADNMCLERHGELSLAIDGPFVNMNRDFCIFKTKIRSWRHRWWLLYTSGETPAGVTPPLAPAATVESSAMGYTNTWYPLEYINGALPEFRQHA